MSASYCGLTPTALTGINFFARCEKFAGFGDVLQRHAPKTRRSARTETFNIPRYAALHLSCSSCEMPPVAQANLNIRLWNAASSAFTWTRRITGLRNSNADIISTRVTILRGSIDRGWSRRKDVRQSSAESFSARSAMPAHRLIIRSRPTPTVAGAADSTRLPIDDHPGRRSIRHSRPRRYPALP